MSSLRSKEVGSISYSYVTIKGHGLCEDDIIKAFANLVRKKVDEKTMKWPPKPSGFLETLENSKPLQCIYNAFVWSINLKRKIYENEYVETYSLRQAGKIAAITQFWESMIYNTQSPTKTALSLTLHHIIGSREATDLLHKFGMGISYTDVRLLTNT